MSKLQDSNYIAWSNSPFDWKALLPASGQVHPARVREEHKGHWGYQHSPPCFAKAVVFSPANTAARQSLGSQAILAQQSELLITRHRKRQVPGIMSSLPGRQYQRGPIQLFLSF